jgi:predicted phosphoadenosine phosphosulfate sulfurtransferase
MIMETTNPQTTETVNWQTAKLPKNRTSWKSYMHALLSALPKKHHDNYLEKLNTSIQFWKTKGGSLSPDMIKKLKKAGVKLEVGTSTNSKTDKLPVKMDYLDDTDIKGGQKIPTYKRVCICILKNDYSCTYMGFSEAKEKK